MAVAVVAVARSVVVMAVVKAVAMEVVVTEVVELAAAKLAVVETVMVVAAMVEAVMAREDEERAAERPSRASCIMRRGRKFGVGARDGAFASRSKARVGHHEPNSQRKLGPSTGARENEPDRVEWPKLHHASSIYSPMMTREAN